MTGCKAHMLHAIMSVFFYFPFFFLSRSTSNLFGDEGCKLVVSRMEYAYPLATCLKLA
jgi:hypothetical protein